MCEKNEKTVQLEGYKFKQCEHGYCYRHEPSWDCPYLFDEVPITTRGILRWIKNYSYEKCKQHGFIIGLFETFKRYRQMKYHCGKRTKWTEQYGTVRCKHCGRSKRKFVGVKARCSCCDYHL